MNYEDTTVLREVFLNFILDGEKKMQLLMNESLAKMLVKFGNTHTVKNFKGRTPHVERRNSGQSYDEKG